MIDLNAVYNTESGKIIKQHLENAIDKLDKVSDIDIDVLTQEGIALATAARVKAIEIMKSVLEIGPYVEDSGLSLEDKKKKYGL